MRKSFENEFGYAKVFDGTEKTLDTTNERFGKEKRPITKSQFMKEWETLDAKGRENLMRTCTPIEE